MNTSQAKHPRNPACHLEGGKLVCKADLDRRETVVLAIMGVDTASHTNTEATHTGGERQNTNRGCVIDRDGWMRC
jgi:hypothetical protein